MRAMLAVFSVLVLVAARGGPHASTSGISVTYYSAFTAYFAGYGYMIEQQTPDPPVNVVVNPYPRDTMLWDVDDLRTILASGSMDAGESFTIDIPAVLDNGGHLLYVNANAGNKGGTVEVSIPALNWTYTRTLSGGDSFCLIGPYFSLSDPRLEPISGSNGGVGLATSYRTTITTNGRAHNAGLSVQIPYANLAQQQNLCGGTTWYDIGGPMALVGP